MIKLNRSSTPLLSLFWLMAAAWANAQQAVPFSEEVSAISAKYADSWDPNKETIVFTGSSSIRMWKDLKERFPDRQIVNSGFGGSQASDLAYFLDELVLRYQPGKVFIYEGDNDLSAKKRPKEITTTMENIIQRIRSTNAATKIYLIAAKPSISRWSIRGKYRRLNRKFNKLANRDALLYFVDVWTPMLNGRKLNKAIFLEDGLHMNPEGYDIWYGAMKTFVNH